MTDVRTAIGGAEARLDTHTGQLATFEERFANFVEKLRRKAEKRDLDQVAHDVKRCALYDDFKELYAKTVEPMSKFTQDMNDYGLEHSQMKEVIAGFDETLALKASKTDHMIL